MKEKYGINKNHSALDHTLVNTTSDTLANGESHLPASILLVEDDRAHAQLIMRALKGLVVEVTHVTNVQDAIQLLRKKDIDLILTDLNLVSSTGFELLHTLKGHGCEIPVIVLTSSANIEDAVRSMRDGAWDYLTKQFTANFSSHLEIVLERNWERALQKRREHMAQAERNAFWMASSLADDGLAILDFQGQMLYSNNSFLTLLKDLGVRDPEQKIDLIRVISKFDFQISQDLFSQIHISEDSLWRSELCFDSLQSDEKKYFELKLSTIQDDGFNDLQNTHRIDREKGLRYHVLWVKDLTQIRKSEQLERDLLATTTHDLKGPLGAILTSADLVLDENPDTFVSDMILRVASCARTCINLVDELLSARRLEDGLMEIHPEWIDITAVAEDVHQDFVPVAKAKNIHFTVVKSSQEILVYADVLAIKRIFSNLIGNALKFTPRNGEVSIDVEKKKNEVLVNISDTGEGICPEKQTRLFEMFRRLPEHAKVEGTGLGLFITKKLVDMHDAKLDLKSTQGQGTTFSIRFSNSNK